MKFFLKTIAICFFFISVFWTAAGNAFAGNTYTFEENKMSKTSFYQKEIEALQADDTVRFIHVDGTVETFVLGKYIDKGEVGRVFILKDTQPNEVIKIQYADDSGRARRFMEEEIELMTQLEKDGLPHSTMTGAHPKFFIKKKYIDGYTVRRMIYDWENESIRLQETHLTELNELIKKFRKVKPRYMDLKPENIMWDRFEQKFVVIDVSRNRLGLRSFQFDEFNEISERYSHFKTAFEFSQRHPKELNRLLKLQKMSLFFDQGIFNGRQLPEFFAEAPFQAKVPLEVQKLWRSGLSKIIEDPKVMSEESEKLKPLIDEQLLRNGMSEKFPGLIKGKLALSETPEEFLSTCEAFKVQLAKNKKNSNQIMNQVLVSRFISNRPTLDQAVDLRRRLLPNQSHLASTLTDYAAKLARTREELELVFQKEFKTTPYAAREKIKEIFQKNTPVFQENVANFSAVNYEQDFFLMTRQERMKCWVNLVRKLIE